MRSDVTTVWNGIGSPARGRSMMRDVRVGADEGASLERDSGKTLGKWRGGTCTQVQESCTRRLYIRDWGI